MPANVADHGVLGWDRLRQREAWAGEVRVALCRLLGLVVFYGHHLLQRYFLGGAADWPIDLHLGVTAIVFAWGGMAVVLYYVLRRGPAHPAVSYLSVLADLIMTTALVAVLGGPRSLFVGLYFVVLAATPLRFSVRLVQMATVAAMAAYLAAVGYYAWFQIGWDRYYANLDLRIPRSEQVAFLLMLAIAGVFAGQSVRQVRRTALDSSEPSHNVKT